MDCRCPIAKLLVEHNFINPEFLFSSKNVF